MGAPIRMDVKGLMVDPASNTPIVILRDPEGQLFLPIWIGVFEANAIALRLEGVEMPRPLTHDLVRALLTGLGVELERVVINDLREGTFMAELVLRQGDRTIVVDSRPSDAIALALRTESPIFVAPDVLEKARTIDLASAETDEERLRKWLEDVGPEDLGKYTM